MRLQVRGRAWWAWHVSHSEETIVDCELQHGPGLGPGSLGGHTKAWIENRLDLELSALKSSSLFLLSFHNCEGMSIWHGYTISRCTF